MFARFRWGGVCWGPPGLALGEWMGPNLLSTLAGWSRGGITISWSLSAAVASVVEGLGTITALVPQAKQAIHSGPACKRRAGHAPLTNSNRGTRKPCVETVRYTGKGVEKQGPAKEPSPEPPAIINQ